MTILPELEVYLENYLGNKKKFEFSLILSAK